MLARTVLLPTKINYNAGRTYNTKKSKLARLLQSCKRCNKLKLNDKLKFKIMIFILLIALLPSITFAQKPSENTPNCNDYLVIISKLNQTIENLTAKLSYYQNLSEYYKNLYENKNSNTTNRELIEIHQNLTVINNNISNLYQKIENIENKITNFSLEIGMSIVGGVAFIEIILYLARRRE